jgi:hypothetical protein
MDASVESSPFKLSIKNMYDDMKPSNMELTVDPNQANLDFNMNYDIGWCHLPKTNRMLLGK